MAQEKQRFFGLDFVRAFVALFVVLHHLYAISPPVAWLLPLGSLGSLGVELLFVLCGFFLGQSLLKMINENRFSTRRELFGLFSKRWLRILPAYYFFFLATAAIFQPFSQLVLSHFEYFFFLQNFAWRMPSFYFQTWTLAILEFFYVLFSLALFLCFKFSKNKLLSFAICLSLFGFIPFLLRATCVPLLGMDDFEATIRRWVIYRLDGPVAGVIMAVLMSEFPQIWGWLRAHSWIGLCLFGGTVVYHLAGFPLLYTNHWLEVLFYPAVCVSFALTLPLLLTWRDNSSLFGAGISFLSKLSYSIYVCHVVAMVLVLNVLMQTVHLNLKNCAVVYPICFGFIILIAWFSYTLIESPFITAAHARTKMMFTYVYGFPRRSLTLLAAGLGLLTYKAPPPLPEGQRPV
jgi:peptidoglycan/LPS O-acetylase OafA/YrhL